MGNCCKKKQSHSEYSLLLESTTVNTPKLSLKNELFLAKCLRVIDGDTVDLSFFYRGVLNLWRVRAEGYDAPELHSKDINEKKAGELCKTLLANLIQEKIVVLKAGGFDKYGRLLGTIYAYSPREGLKVVNVPKTLDIFGELLLESSNTSSLINVNKWMLNNTTCNEYYGKKKQKFLTTEIVIDGEL